VLGRGSWVQHGGIPCGVLPRNAILVGRCAKDGIVRQGTENHQKLKAAASDRQGTKHVHTLGVRDDDPQDGTASWTPSDDDP
jgi:hypothetical protein